MMRSVLPELSHTAAEHSLCPGATACRFLTQTQSFHMPGPPPFTCCPHIQHRPLAACRVPSTPAVAAAAANKGGVSEDASLLQRGAAACALCQKDSAAAAACALQNTFCCCSCCPATVHSNIPPKSISAVGRGSLTHLQQLPGCTVVQRVGCVACRPQQAGHQGVNVNICVAAAAAAQAATAGTAGAACTAAAQVVAVETDHSHIGVGERGLQSHSPQSTFGCLIHTTHNQASSLRPTHQHTPLLLC